MLIHLIAADGCDSIVTMDLTVHPIYEEFLFGYNL